MRKALHLEIEITPELDSMNQNDLLIFITNKFIKKLKNEENVDMSKHIHIDAINTYRDYNSMLVQDVFRASCIAEYETEPSVNERGGYNPLSKSGKCMTFGQALDYIKHGFKVARQGWNGKGMFIFLVLGSTFQVNRPPLLGIYDKGATINYQPHIDMKTADNTIVPWLASQTDMLAEDWELVE